MPRYITKSSTASTSSTTSRLEEIKLAQEEAKLAILEGKRLKPKKLEHIPYDEIPPPSEEESRIIQDRLNAIYERICTTHAQEKYDKLMHWANSPYSP
ncbi:MAG: hypothetical protein COA43_15535 [Robiginitomaculum sp.]|nr:MAG: hypothetical protein COA43_15535 [Robiginitomaculum sp.]